MGSSESKIDAQTVNQNRTNIAAAQQDIVAMDRKIQTQKEHTKQRIKTHQESVDASLKSVNKKIEDVHQQLQAHESTSAELRTGVNDLEDKVKILKLETEKAEKERRKTDSELKKIQLEMERENKKSNNELEKLKLVLRHQQGKMQHQREMKEMERESKNGMQMTVNQIKNLRDSLPPEQFDMVLKIMIPASLPSPMDEVDNEISIGTEELDREEDSFVDSPRPDYPRNWTGRPFTTPQFL